MRSARKVPNKWTGLLLARFFGRAYPAPFVCFVINMSHANSVGV